MKLLSFYYNVSIVKTTVHVQCNYFVTHDVWKSNDVPTHQISITI